MRPPHCAGEISRRRCRSAAGWRASMRPPHCAGEISQAAPVGSERPARFNEAPALRGGNPLVQPKTGDLAAPLQ